MAVCVLLAAGVCAIGAPLDRASRPSMWFGAAGGIAVATLAFFSFRTLQYLPVWRNTDALWTYTVERTTGSLARIGLEV